MALGIGGTLLGGTIIQHFKAALADCRLGAGRRAGAWIGGAGRRGLWLHAGQACQSLRSRNGHPRQRLSDPHARRAAAAATFAHSAPSVD